MVDPVSIGASAAGFLSLAITVTKGLRDYCSAIKDEEQRTIRLATDLEDLLVTLEFIQSCLGRRKSSHAGDRTFVEKVEGSIVSCREAIQDLETTLNRVAPCKQSGFGVRASILKMRRRVMYPMKESTIFRLQKDISEMRQNLALALEGLQTADTTHIRKDVANTKALVELLRDGQVSSEILRWLNPVDATLDHDKATNERHPATGLWLVTGNDYKNWLTQPHSNLWLKGFAGCGKSILCSTAIDYAIRYRGPNPRIAIAFFYFKFDDNSKRDLTALLRVLVLQLSRQCGNDFKELRRSLNRHSGGPPRQELERLFRELLQHFNRTYVCIDAIDESPAISARGEVLRFLASLSEIAENDLHLLVASREERDIVETLSKSYHAVSMKNDGVDEDIALYVSEQLKGNVNLKKWSAQHALIENALTTKANGVFRWVECQLISIRGCPVIPAVLRNLLDSLPQDLDKTYERMLENIPSVLTQYARKILLLLCFSERPLTVEEIIDAIAVDIETGFDPQMRCNDMQDILQICQGLVEVFEDTHNFLPAYKIRIAHFSVQQYLFSKQLEEHQTLSAMHLKDVDAQADIAQICLKYLLDDAVLSCHQSIIFLPEYPFAGYAADHWSDHFLRARTRVDVLDLAVQFFSSTRAFEKLKEIVSSNPRYLWKYAQNEKYWFIKRNFRQLPFASRLRLTDIICRFLERPGISDEYGRPIDNLGSIKNALYQAMQWRSADIVRVLVQHLMHFDLPESFWDEIDYKRALSHPHDEIARLLMDAGAPLADYQFWKKNSDDIADMKSSGPTPRVLELLLDRGLAFEDQTDDQLAPLILAIGWKNVDSLKHLIDRGYEPNAQTTRGKKTPLSEAIHQKAVEMVEALLKHGADPNLAACSTSTPEGSKDEDTFSPDLWPPLAIATRSKQKNIVKALLDYGTSPDHLTYAGSPLLDEAAWCVEGLVPLLVQNGVSMSWKEARVALNAKGKAPGSLEYILQCTMNLEPETLLEIHSAIGNFEKVQSLLDTSATVVDSQALFFAAKHGQVDVLPLLIARGAKLTAEQFAALYNCADEVKGLIEDRIDECLDSGTMTPLEFYLACRYGWKQTARVCLQSGVDPNTIVQSHGADTKKTGQTHGEDKRSWETTPLGGAVASGDFDLVQAIVDKGGDIHSRAERDGNSRSDKRPCILEIGASFNHARIVQFLIDRGELEVDGPDGERIKYWPGTLSNAIGKAVELDAADALEVLLDRTLGRLGDNIDAQELTRCLEYAALGVCPAATRVLLKRGAMVTEDTLVASQGQREVLDLLLQHYDLEGRVEERREYKVPESLMLPEEWMPLCVDDEDAPRDGEPKMREIRLFFAHSAIKGLRRDSYGDRSDELEVFHVAHLAGGILL